MKRRKNKNSFFKKKKFAVIVGFSILFVIFFYFNISIREYSYDFEDDIIGSFPKGFVGIGRPTKYTKVVEWNRDDGHKGKVVEINQLDRIYLDKIDYSGIELNTVFSKATKGFISFDVYVVNNLGVAIDICQEDLVWNKSDDICIRIGYEGHPYIWVRNSEGRLENIMVLPLILERWYNFKINFDTEKNEWDIEVYNKDMTLMAKGNFRFYIQPTHICQLYFAAYTLGGIFYIDNVVISLSTLSR